MEARITLNFTKERDAEAVAKAVCPDNFVTPKGLTVHTSLKKGTVYTSVICKGKLSTFISTIDDFLSAVSTAEGTLKILGTIQ